mmetsp:Transcript_24764/g.58043  ORF Transcript_24764/g.58043 Transcript_24764/m.58043 type:complete len:257 (+) Transcript_24764:163-933(+)
MYSSSFDSFPYFPNDLCASASACTSSFFSSSIRSLLPFPRVMKAAAIQSAVDTATHTPPHARLHECGPSGTVPPESAIPSSRSAHGSVQKSLSSTAKLSPSIAPTAICSPPTTLICMDRLRAFLHGQPLIIVQSLNTATNPNMVAMYVIHLANWYVASARLPSFSDMPSYAPTIVPNAWHVPSKPWASSSSGTAWRRKLVDRPYGFLIRKLHPQRPAICSMRAVMVKYRPAVRTTDARNSERFMVSSGRITSTSTP